MHPLSTRHHTSTVNVLTLTAAAECRSAPPLRTSRHLSHPRGRITSITLMLYVVLAPPPTALIWPYLTSYTGWKTLLTPTPSHSVPPSPPARLRTASRYCAPRSAWRRLYTPSPPSSERRPCRPSAPPRAPVRRPGRRAGRGRGKPAVPSPSRWRAPPGRLLPVARAEVPKEGGWGPLGGGGCGGVARCRWVGEWGGDGAGGGETRTETRTETPGWPRRSRARKLPSGPAGPAGPGTGR